ncbi:MAG: SPW repeat protein [Thermomicrobiales bacterium]
MLPLDRGHIAQLLVSLCGIWLMASPAVLDYGDPIAVSDRVVGPLLVTAGGVAVWEVVRRVRFAALPLAAWLLIAPWILGAPADATISNMAAGLAAGLLCLVRGNPSGAFGGGWTALWTTPSPYEDNTIDRKKEEDSR